MPMIIKKNFLIETYETKYPLVKEMLFSRGNLHMIWYIWYIVVVINDAIDAIDAIDNIGHLDHAVYFLC